MTPLRKRLLTYGALVLLAVIIGIYAWLSYGQSIDNGMSIPEQGRDAYDKTKNPIQKFEKDMGQRVEDAKSGGVDLGKEKPVDLERK